MYSASLVVIAAVGVMVLLWVGFMAWAYLSGQLRESERAKRLPLERHYRDVRAGPIHPIGGFDALELVGKHAFGLSKDVQPRYV